MHRKHRKKLAVNLSLILLNEVGAFLSLKCNVVVKKCSYIFWKIDMKTHFYLVKLLYNTLVQHSIMHFNLIYIALLGNNLETLCLQECSNDIDIIDLSIKFTCNNTREVLKIHFTRVVQISNIYLHQGAY